MLLLFSVSAAGLLVRLAGTPPARFPPNEAKFVSARFEGNATSGSADTGWVTIDTMTPLDPVTVDAANPPSYIFTALSTDTTLRWFRIVWVDEDAAETKSAVWAAEAPLDTSLRPGIDEVSLLLHARTKTRGGAEEGRFTDTTRPTATDVEGMIDRAMALVLATTGAAPTDTECPQAGMVRLAIRALVSMRTALFIEPSMWPEQVASRSASAYDVMQQQYEADLPRVAGAALDCRNAGEVVPGDDGGGPDSPANASWWFPDDDGGLVGWGSQW